MEFSRPEYWSGQSFPFPEDLPKPGIKPRSPAMQADSLPDEPQGKPKNTGVGSLSLLQGDLPNPGILHFKWILYKLSYEGSPKANWASFMAQLVKAQLVKAQLIKAQLVKNPHAMQETLV